MYADNQQSGKNQPLPIFRRFAPSPAGRSPQRAGSHAKCVRILHGARGEGWGGGSIRNFTANAIQTPLRQHTFQDTIQFT